MFVSFEGGERLTLKEMRLRSGLRQEDVARKLNVDQTAVSHWENGRTRPCRKYRKKLAKLYGVGEEEINEASE